MDIGHNKCMRCRKRKDMFVPCNWLKQQTSIVILECPEFEEEEEEMPGHGKQIELQKQHSKQAKEWFDGMYTIRQAVDIAKLCDLMQDSECPAWRWFPDNAEIKKMAEYLVVKGVTFEEERE